MWLVRQTKVKLDPAREIVVGHLCYSAAKVWNAALFERREFRFGAGKTIPDLRSQKCTLEDNVLFKQLGPSVAGEVLKKVDWAWKSYWARKKSNVENVQMPNYQGDKFICVFPRNSFYKRNDKVIIPLSSFLTGHLQTKFGIENSSLVLQNDIFVEFDDIAHLELFPPSDGIMRVNLLYRAAEENALEDNGRYLSVDLGIKKSC